MFCVLIEVFNYFVPIKEYLASEDNFGIFLIIFSLLLLIHFIIYNKVSNSPKSLGNGLANRIVKDENETLKFKHIVFVYFALFLFGTLFDILMKLLEFLF